MLIPSDVEFDSNLLKRYQNLNPELQQVIKDYDSTALKSRKNRLRQKIRQWYRENNLKLNDKMMSATNVVIETLEQTLKLIELRK